MKTRSGVVMCAVVGLFLVSGSALVAQGKGANPNGKPFIELQGQIIEVEGEVASLQDQVDSLVGRVGTMEERLAADERAIADLFTANSILQSQMTASIQDLQDDIDLLEAQNVVLESQIEANLGDIGALAQQIATNDGLISAMQQSISELGFTLQDQIDNNFDLIGALQSEIATFEELMALRELLANGQCPLGWAVREIQSDGSVVCEDVGDGVSPGLEVVRVYERFDTCAGCSARKFVYCPAGFQATGPGWFAWGFRWDFSIPSDTAAGWMVQATNENTYDSEFYLFVMCIRLVP